MAKFSGLDGKVLAKSFDFSIGLFYFSLTYIKTTENSFSLCLILHLLPLRIVREMETRGKVS